MSERTFVRRFRETTGSAPGEWLTDVRIDEAKRSLERSALPIEEVARLGGFGSLATLRHHFTRATGVPPRDYRERFRYLKAA